MTTLHGKLFAWHRLQLQYDAARERLKHAMAGVGDDPAVLALHAEIERLRGEMDVMLQEIDRLRRQRGAGVAE